MLLVRPCGVDKQRGLVCQPVERLACSQLKSIADGRHLRDVTGSENSMGERGESVEQPRELVVVEAVVGGEGDAVGAIFHVVFQLLAAGRELAVSAEQAAIDELR